MATLTVISTADSGAGSLRQAIADAQTGDTIVFDDSLEVDGVITILLSSQISLPAKDLTIDGGGHTGSGATLQTRVVLDGQDAVRCLYSGVSNTNNVYGITFLNGSISSSGGGFNGTLQSITNFNHCVFKNCSASSGGALYTANSSSTTCTNCAFYNNYATTYHGGVLYSANSASVAFNNCIFKNCSAVVYGGALYVSAESVVTVNSCVFDSNNANNNAADIYTAGTSITTLNNCFYITASGYTKYGVINHGTNLNGSLVYIGNNTIDRLLNDTNATLIIKGFLKADVLTISNGATVTFSGVDAVLAVTNTATIGSSTFTAAADSTGYIALPSGTTAPTVGTGITVCTYGAGIESASLSKTTVSWTATNLSTDILIQQQNGDSWTTLTTTGTGGSYSGTFAEGTTVRLFDGVAFYYASTQFPYWVVNNYAVTNNEWIVVSSAIATNGGGGTDPVTGDPLTSWTVQTVDITPNFQGL